MIFTCTLNPSVDYVVEVDNVELGDLNRAKKTAFYPGGKGINVSRVLKKLGITNTALGFVGGFTGEFITNSLKKEGILQDFTLVDEDTRVNVKLKSSVETEVNGQGAVISKEKEQELFEKITTMTAEDYLILAGSLPPSISPDFYQKIAAQCNENNVHFVVDTSGKALEEVLPCQPFLIKPNQHELGELFNVQISSIENAVKYGRKLLENGPENVIVSLGGDGALLLNKEVSAYANVPKGELKNSVGAGDSLVAGFISSYVENGDLIEAFKYGIAAGSATAFSSDLCNKSSLENLLPEIKIEILN
ncbi:1-phosphofructokinase [Anaerobacillus arseniciselenatis]|uniref:Tagatose-6-phosphate kinase n=1 Tax=Anaerobacillus arseniciselenatis TaxID=85682 RepID=A0A1S2LND8_9BACI|nr:1-phosphofructokinase [Anaerobacillus arseniciselenatis]OIJ13866.1 1-phosphofructokinase [Anaerobacillus arseniciselenatis]